MSVANTVTVACKIPNGLILQLERRETVVEPSPAGGRKVEVGRKVGEPIRLNGPATPLTGQPPNHPIIGGFGLTYGVPKEFWDKWLEQNAELECVKGGLIFAHEKRDTVEAKSRELKGLRSNMEPLDPESRNVDKSFKDPRMMKNVQKQTDSDGAELTA